MKYFTGYEKKEGSTDEKAIIKGQNVNVGLYKIHVTKPAINVNRKVINMTDK